MRIYASFACAGVVVSGLLMLTLHFAHPELNPFTRAMSDYVHSRYGVLLVTTLIVFALGLLSLAEALRRVVTSSVQQIGVVLLVAASLSMLVAAIFPIDDTKDGSFNTLIGAVHVAASFLMSPLLVAGILCLLRPCYNPGDHRILPSLGVFLGILTSFMFAGLLAINLVLHLPIGGLAQRVFMGMVGSWQLVVSIQLVVVGRTRQL